jgi:hypothetical protein
LLLSWEAIGYQRATVPLPEAPVSITLPGLSRGHEVSAPLRGTDFTSVKMQIEDARQWV